MKLDIVYHISLYCFKNQGLLKANKKNEFKESSNYLLTPHVALSLSSDDKRAEGDKTCTGLHLFFSNRGSKIFPGRVWCFSLFFSTAGKVVKL